MSRSPGLSHSTSAPSNVGQSRSRVGPGRGDPGPPDIGSDQSDDSRSTNQNQDSRPGSSQRKSHSQRKRGTLHQDSRPIHPNYKLSQQQQQQQQQPAQQQQQKFNQQHQQHMMTQHMGI